jgi:mono/diheme cytochrome c family protein
MLGLVLLATMPAMGADLANGKKVYTDKCARCHGGSGRGDGPRAKALDKKPRDYADAGEMEKITDADPKKIVLQGKGAMPSYKGRVSDKDLEGVIAYIRTFAKR